MPAADQAFSALLDDLANRRMLEETLVVWTGEFGRTPRVGQRNSDAGRGVATDAIIGRTVSLRRCWPAVASAAGKSTAASSDRSAAYPASNAVHPVDLVATVNHCLGVSNDLTLADPQGRPVVYCPGSPVNELLG